MEQSNLFRFSGITLPKSAKLRVCGIYLLGALYSFGFWSIIDAALYSKTVNTSTVHFTFTDWIPFISSTLGMFIVNSIEKSALFSTSFGNSSSAAARVILFFGFALLAGGVAGSFMVLILKFLLHHYTFPTLGMGISNVVSNVAVMLSCIVLWISQNIQDEYSYSLAL